MHTVHCTVYYKRGSWPSILEYELTRRLREFVTETSGSHSTVRFQQHYTLANLRIVLYCMQLQPPGLFYINFNKRPPVYPAVTSTYTV